MNGNCLINIINLNHKQYANSSKRILSIIIILIFLFVLFCGCAMGDKASFNSPANIHTKELRTNNSEDSYKNGRYLINIGKINDAIGPLKNFINIHPTNWSALYLLGYIYIKEAENNKSYYNYSIFYFDKAINTNKSEKKTWYYKGLAYYELGEYNKSNYNESINALIQALKIDENYTDALYLGLVYFEMARKIIKL